MQLFDTDPGRGGRLGDVTDEALVLEHTGQTVLRPEVSGQPVAFGIDEQKLDLVADQRLQAGRGEPGFDARQGSPGT